MAPTIKRGRIGSRSLQKAFDQADALPTFAVADLPAAAQSTGKMVYVSDGAGGSPCLAYCDGTDWLQITLGSAVAGA